MKILEKKFFFLKFKYLLLFGFLLSCRSTNIYKEVATFHSIGSKLSIDSTLITLENSTKSYIFSSLSVTNRDYVAFLTKGKITIYDLESAKSYRQISIPQISSEDSSGYNINSICLADTNDIFTLSTNLITRYFKDSIFYTKLNTRPQHRLIYNLQNDHPFFDSSEQAIYAEEYSTKYSQSDKEFYTSPIYAQIDIHSGVVTDLPVFFSKLYTKYYYGFVNLPYISSAGSSIILSFPADPNIYAFDWRKNITRVFGGRSSYQINKIEPLSEEAKNSKEEKMKFWYQTPEYNETLITKDQGYVFRFFKAGQPLKDANAKYHSYNDKQMYLMLFKKDSLLMELSLNYKIYNNFLSFTGNHCLYIECGKSSEQNIVFKKYKIVE